MEMLGRDVSALEIESTSSVAPLKSSVKGQIGLNPAHENAAWATLYSVGEQDRDKSFHWKTSQIRKNYLVSLDVPVNLDEMYGKTVTWDTSTPAQSETDEQIEIRQLLALGDAEYSDMSNPMLQAHLDQLKNVLQRVSHQINRATEQRDRFTRDIDKHNKVIASLVFIAQQQRSRK